ncbi:predicted protein [Histoplasma capsulatum H143]|uniref:Uncharacterized protein n=1 Tax=Ajellomyces capsulatus (strain H143) TaxID=544712 RepID=C6HDV8_AJECH|nr:predicted protein [Histoplasma capsulatum H143]
MANRNLPHDEGYLYQHYLGWQGADIPQETQESILPALENDPPTGGLEFEAADQIAGQTPQTEKVQSSSPPETVESCLCTVEEYAQLKSQMEELNTQITKLTARMEELYKDMFKLQGSMERLQPWTEQITTTVYELSNWN